MSEDLLKEIDADMRAETIKNAARRYVVFVVVLIVVALVALGIWQYKSWQHHKAIQAASFSYFNTMQPVIPMMEGQTVPVDAKNAAIKQLKTLSDHSPQSIRALSQLERAGLLADQGKIKEASVIWETLRADQTASSAFRSLAGLLWIQHHLDNASPADLRTRINELLGQQTPWYGLLKESEALLNLRTGKLIEARQIFGQLSIDMNTSPGLRQRASVMLQIIAHNKTVNKKGNP
ncbi:MULTISPECIES: tetratricopeptide repeat protein [Commensalibacter]|uniref:Tetratricopeptide repeat-like domain-containing protein n=2 Tax=Commensalibacter TaxID=1079922 RepID=W7E0N6_9PROT|nr:MULTISPECIES: tetratricopeptide repeat protein [Commensalibacter]EUK18589.1 hypothetical protein COMX_02535 [Commensalibacter papalotli (ex Servin-Garciduenas et al. 2014)]CAI3931114.1 TPR-like repeat domain (TPR1) [Commensalibacter papalotli (ex Botero et al. 2024)]CAI3944531.1 TPR-like repeat domain (TPR1) [Commensalibacter papalotli (ex Botero et al. 2024)]